MDTKWLSIEDTTIQPRYRALADGICAAIGRGEITPGERLPPVRDLAWNLKISPGAVARAYRLGVERGALEAVVGRGTFARAPSNRPNYAIDGLLARSTDGETIDLRGNQAISVGQDVEIGAALARLIARHDGCPPLTCYRQPEEDYDATCHLADWLRRSGIPAEPERLLVTSGAQTGVISAMSLLSRGGSGIVLTTPTIHPGLRDGATAIGVKLESVAADDEGMLPDALDTACRRLRPDAIQISATLHNPTLSLMGETRREAIAAVTRTHGIPLIEDDVYGQLIDPVPVSFATLLPDLCWYVASFSKSVAAGLRAGLVLTPPDRRLATFRAYQALAHQTPWLVKALAAELVAGGEAEKIRARVAAETARRAELAARILGPFGARTHPAASFVFLPLAPPWSSAEFVSAAAAEGVLVPPAGIYRTSHGGQEFARVALGPKMPLERLEAGLHRLASVLHAGAGATAPVT